MSCEFICTCPFVAGSSVAGLFEAGPLSFGTDVNDVGALIVEVVPASKAGLAEASYRGPRSLTLATDDEGSGSQTPTTENGRRCQ